MEALGQQTSIGTDSEASSARCEGKATVGKPRAREVPSRYMQSKPTSAAPRSAAGPNLQGRHSLAACHSTGWVELQLENSTPLMMNTGASSAVFTQTDKARRMQTLPIPTPRTAQRFLHHQGNGQQQRRQVNQQRQQQQVLQAAHSPQQLELSAAVNIADTPRLQQRQHGTETMPDTSCRQPRASSRPPGLSLLPAHTSAALISPGSSRSSTSCSTRPALDVIDPELVQQPGPQVFRTPQVCRLGASMHLPSTAVQLNRLGMSADVTSLADSGSTAASGAQDRRRQLEEYRQQRQQQHRQLAQRNAARASQGGFKQPQPKLLSKVGAAPSADVKGASGAANSRTSATPVVSGTGSATTSRSASVENSSSPSQFTATMQTLQHSGSGSKLAKPHSSSKSVRPAGVPLLQMDRLQHTPGSSPFQVAAQQQAGKSPFAPGSCSRIPSFSSGGGHTEAMTPPLSSRAVSSAAHVPLPDATPRAIRDAPPSKLPKTPRGEYSGPKTVVADDDVAAHPAKPAVPGLKLGGLAVVDRTAPSPAEPPPASSRRSGGGSGDLATAAVQQSRGNHALNAIDPNLLAVPAANPPSARKAAVLTSSRQAGRYTSSSSSTAAQQQPQPEYSRILKTPRVPPTPRAAVDSAASRKSDQERVEETRLQLRLLRNQNLQLRFLSCRVEQAVQQKREKAAEALAAAAAAIVDLYGQLAAVQKQLQQEQWTSELDQVLQRQLPKLRSWSRLQEQTQADIAQLQHACSAALSHVPLLNGAVVGPHPERPDLELLQRQLVHGMQLMDEAKPALQQLLGPDLLASQSSVGAGAAAPNKQQVQPGRAAETCSSISTTASLAEQLMSVATEELGLLGELAQRLDRLSDLHLYANSMQIQLAHMKQVAASD